MILRTLIVSAILLLSGCGLSPSKAPQEHYYRLADALPIAGDGLPAGKIAPVQASGIYNERAILYRKAERPLEIHRYHYHLWTQTPARLVQQYMQQALQNIIQKSGEDKPLIKTEIIRFERLLDGDQASADIALKITTDKGSKIYQARVEAAGKGMHESVAAFGKGMQQIMQQLARDIGKKS